MSHSPRRAAQLTVGSAEGPQSHLLPYAAIGAILQALRLMLAFAAQPQTRWTDGTLGTAREAAPNPCCHYSTDGALFQVHHTAAPQPACAEFSKPGNKPGVGMSILVRMPEFLRVHIGTMLALVGVILWTVAIVDWCSFDHFLNSWWWR